MELFEKYLLGSQGNLNFLGKILKILIVYVLLRLGLKFIRRFIKNRYSVDKLGDSLEGRRMETIGNTFYNLIKALFYFFFILMSLEMFDIDTKSILATAGIGGVAIGFGAQSLVKDSINGFFILQENTFVVGDHIKVQDLEGIVEELGIRTTRIRGFDGALHTIPNGEIQVISNYSRGAIRALVVASVAYEEDLNKAIRVLNRISQEIVEEYKEDFEEPFKIDGIDDLGDYGVDIRISGMVKSGEQWKVERALKKRIKEELEIENIEIPYPRLVLLEEEI